MVRSRVRCQVCKGCMDKVYYNNLQIYYCSLCDLFYRMNPGLRLVQIRDNQMIERIKFSVGDL